MPDALLINKFRRRPAILVMNKIKDAKKKTVTTLGKYLRIFYRLVGTILLMRIFDIILYTYILCRLIQHIDIIIRTRIYIIYIPYECALH